MTVLRQWYHLSAPTGELGGFMGVSRERVRRGQLASMILLVVILLQLLTLLDTVLSGNYRSLPVVALSLAICALAVPVNRQGSTAVAGILVITVIDLGCGLLLLTTPNGLDVGDLPAYDVLAESVLVAVSLLPLTSVFLVALGNCVFILADLAFQPHTAALGHLLAAPHLYDVLSRPIGLQLVTALVSYLWVRSAVRASARADRAEEIAELRRCEAERSRQLEAGIQQLLETHVRVSNGDFLARATLSRDNVLWQVGASLNLLLARLHRARDAEDELRRLREDVARITAAVRESKFGRWSRGQAPSGTLLDPLVQELFPAHAPYYDR
jgi:hypothetical protein